MWILDRSQTKNRLKALTLIELLVAFLLLAVVGGAFFYAFFLGDSERRISRTIQSMDEDHQESLAQVQKMINDAARVNGFSANLLPGIQNTNSPAANRQNLTVRRQRFPEITASLDSISIVTLQSPARYQITFLLKDVLNPTTPEQTNRRDSLDVISHFLRNPSGVRRPLLFINGSTRNILEVQSLTGARLGPFRAEILVGSGANAVDLNRLQKELSVESVVSMVEAVGIEFTSTGEWQVRETFEDPNSPKITRLSSDLRQLRYFFEFGNHLREGGSPGILVVVPDRLLQNWDASDYLVGSGCTTPGSVSLCCNPSISSISCVGPSDLASVRIDSQWAKEFKDRKQMNFTDSRLSLANGELLKTFLFSMVPRNYALESEDGGALAVSTNCMAPENRCKPGCGDYFNSDDRGSPRWKGYGMYVGRDSNGAVLKSSGYCRCGTRDPGERDGVVGETDYTTFVPPDTPAGRLNIEAYRPPLLVGGAPNPANLQVNGCAAHFGDVYEFASKHPPMWVWRISLETQEASERTHTGTGSNSPGSWYRTTNPSSEIDQFTWHWNRFQQFWTNYEDQPARNADGSVNSAAFWAKHARCALNRDFVSGEMRKMFYQVVGGTTHGSIGEVTAPPNRPPFGPVIPPDSGEPSTPRFAAPIEEKCLCRTEEPIFTREVCNHAASPTAVVCPNTWETAGDPAVGQYVAGTESNAEGLKRKIYRVNSSEPGGFTDALSLTQAARCQCLSETYNPPYSNTTTMPYYEGHAFSNAWDFRVDPTSPVFLSSISNGFTAYAGPTTGTQPNPVPVPIITFTPSSHSGSNTSFVPPPPPPPTPPGPDHWTMVFRNTGLQPAHASPYVRMVKVHYKDSATGAVKTTQDFIRCDSVWHNVQSPWYVSKCTAPYNPADTALTNIRSFLLSRSSASGLTEQQVDAYLGYCRNSCVNEQEFAFNADAWYVQSGVAWIRARITGTAGGPNSINNIPTQCGGRIINWVPQN